MTSAELNPYESPRADTLDAPPESLPDDSPRLWRQGDMLVMHREARFPPRCIMTNEPADEAYPWHFGNWLGRSTVSFPLSPAYVAWYRRTLALVWGAWIVVVAASFGWAFLAMKSRFNTAWPALMAFFGSLLLLAIHLYFLDPVRLHHSEGSYCWIRGLHPDFLADLPEWPYNSR